MGKVSKGVDETVLPIKDKVDRDAFKRYWLGQFKSKPKSSLGLRNCVIFQLGIVTGLRASDLTRLKFTQVYDEYGKVRDRIINQQDKKTGKKNMYLTLKPVTELLEQYYQWYVNYYSENAFLFPSSRTNQQEPIKPHGLYMLLTRASKAINYKEPIGTHSLRKTFGYLAYNQTGNLQYVQKRLNHSSPETTLRYIGLDERTMNDITNSINFE